MPPQYVTVTSRASGRYAMQKEYGCAAQGCQQAFAGRCSAFCRSAPVSTMPFSLSSACCYRFVFWLPHIPFCPAVDKLSCDGEFFGYGWHFVFREPRGVKQLAFLDADVS